jgi:hypothetical protein
MMETAVSLLQQIFEGSLVSRQRLMEARQYYSPRRGPVTPEQAFAGWTDRVAIQTALGGARELAGLSDAELSSLEAEFERNPVRPRSSRFRNAFRVGLALAAAGALALALQAVTVGFGDGALRALQLLSMACALAGGGVIAVQACLAFSALHLDLAHGTLGLYVGRLDDQHPWLYEAMAATRNASAEEYRQRVLRERGPLRGVDHVVMAEFVRVQASLDKAQWARTVAEQLQRPGTAPDPKSSEPRLVRVGARTLQ